MVISCKLPCVIFGLVLLFVWVLDARAQETAATEQPRILPVVLSEQHEKLCKVKVGDPLPALELRSMSGEENSLPEYYGKSATVILFWHGNGWMTRAALRDLGPDVAEPFRKQNVAVVTVAVNLPADVTEAILEKAESKLTTLLDPEGKAFAQIGEENLPRVFVIDGEGKIVWFDLEYSNSTRRELRQAVESLTK